MDIERLHLTGDCFVSTHRGEGWGRPQMEAMKMAKPVISTNCGGIHEYLDEKLAFLCKFKPEPVIPDKLSENYQDGQNWAEIDIEDLKMKMRFVFENQEKAKFIGVQAQKHIAENFNLVKVGQLMKKRLEEIL
jgi:glycosyltransferase involved in cell wall biosynthesis